MPNRLIREGMLDSEAVLSVPVEARWLFVTIMLSADDVGLFEATEFRLGRRADVGRDSVGRLLVMLADADLIRLYDVDGKRFGFIPRFAQRVQIKRTRHPLPPRELMADDSDASNKINYLASKTTVGAPVGSGCATDAQPSEVEVEVKTVSEEAKASSSSPGATKRQAERIPDCPADGIVALYHEVLPALPRCRLMPKARAAAIRKVWRWVLTSTKSDGQRRASTAAEGLSWLRGYFERASANDFLMGRTQRGGAHANWQCDLDFLLTDRGMKQVIEKTVDHA